MKSNTPPHVATLHLEREQAIAEDLELVSRQDLGKDVREVVL